MTQILVTKTETSGGWKFQVTVAGPDATTLHQVTLSRDTFEFLRKGEDRSPEDLIRKSFEFLLERESNGSILSRFDLTVISQYFPEFTEEISKRL